MKRTALIVILALLLAAAPVAAELETYAITIAAATDTSGTVDLGKKPKQIYLILIPAVFTGATISFECSTTYAGTFAEIVDADGTALSVTATDAKWVSLSSIAGSLTSCRFLRIVSASTEGTARSLTMMVIR